MCLVPDRDGRYDMSFVETRDCSERRSAMRLKVFSTIKITLPMTRPKSRAPRFVRSGLVDPLKALQVASARISQR